MPTSIIQFRKWRKETEIRLGGKCVKCGSVDELEFDHIDPSTKLFSVSKCWGISNKELLETEIRKCQLLCRICHQEKTSRENAARMQKDRSKCHGTLSQYFRYKCRCEKCRAFYSQWRKNRRRIAHVAQLA